MRRESHDDKGQPADTGRRRSATRAITRLLWVVLFLLLVIGSMRWSRPAEAAPAADASVGIGLFAQQVKAEQTICAGDKVAIRVRVMKRIGVEGSYALVTLTGEEINAYVDGSGVGSISPSRTTTGLNSRPAGAAYFTFSAEKSGTTSVVFQAKVNQRSLLGVTFSGDTVTTALPLKVENCRYRVTSFSRWHVQGDAEIKVIAQIQDAGMAEDGGGHYTGTADVSWVIVPGQVGTCSATATTPGSRAELNGQVYGPEEFTVNLKFLPASVTLNVDCGDGAVGTFPIELIPDSLTVSIPAAGGSERQAQQLQGVEPTVGSIVVIVKRAAGD